MDMIGNFITIDCIFELKNETKKQINNHVDLEFRNVSGASRPDDMTTMSDPFTFQSQRSRNDVVEVERRPKFNLKDLLLPPGRTVRPKKYVPCTVFRNTYSTIEKWSLILYIPRIVIIMRGVPGSGKSYLSKLIKEKEHEMSGSARILSIDDYFMDNDGKELSYEFDASMEEQYTQYLFKSFKKTLLDNFYECIIVDCKNTTLNHLNEFYTLARSCFSTVSVLKHLPSLLKCSTKHGLFGISLRP